MNQLEKCRRVVVTGMGLVTPIGVNVKENWANLIEGKSGIVSLEGDEEFKNLKSQIGGKLPKNLDLDQYKTSFGDARIFSLANAVTKEAIDHAKLDFNQMNRDRVGIVLGNQFGVVENTTSQNKLRLLKSMNNMVASIIAMNYQLTGQVQSTSMASASGSIAIGEAYRQIKHGYSDCVIAGGVDFNLNRNFFEGMELFGANCNTYNDDPQRASRPFDDKRQGPVLSDGGGVLILESLENAIKRRTPQILCEIGGYSQNTDAFHILRPTDNGIGLVKAIRETLLEAQITPSKVDCINSHATSTPAGDLSEAVCFKQLFGNKDIWDSLSQLKNQNIESILSQQDLNNQNMKKASITAQKGHIGHTFCAAGAVEAIFGILSMENNLAPMILNLENPLDVDLNFAQQNQQKKINTVLKTSLAFGGINSALLFKSFNSDQKL